MKSLYPEIEPYSSRMLAVDGLHRIYLEECGNPQGIPVVYLHGGPASGCKPDHRRFFDPALYRVVLFDQRGSGRSEPFGELRHNTTADLLGDLERIRRELGIDAWMLYGGSWGAALALLYAQKHPPRVRGMVLRGTFLARRRDLDWFSRDGANRVYPEQWQSLMDSLGPGPAPADLIAALEECLRGPDELARIRVAREWEAWGAQVALGNDYDPRDLENHEALVVARQVRIEMHYAKNLYFLEDNQILDHCSTIRRIPTIILHGRQDLVCPVEAAYSLHRQLPGAEFRVLARAGHVARGEEMIDALIDATDRMARRLVSGG